MKKMIGYALALLTFATGAISAASSPAWAQDEEIAGITAITAEEATKGVFESPVTVSGRVGALGYQATDQSYTSRMIQGITVQWNASDRMANLGNAIVGLETGLLYSHNGAVGSNFFGTDSTAATGRGANSFLIPLNAVAGYRLSDNLHIAGFLGTNMIYRSVGNSMILGRASDSSTGSSTDFFPDLGVNVGWSATKNLGITLRAEVIPTPAAPLYTATLGATIPLA